MVDQQVKLFKLYNQESVKSLSNIFGQDSIVKFNDSNIVGIKYDYDKNKLKNIMQMAPFTLIQQLIITSHHFVNIIEKIGSKGYRPNITLSTEIPEEEMKLLREYIFRISRPNINGKKYGQLILKEINRLEFEYEVELESVSFTSNNERIVLRNNGIVFANENSFNLAGELLNH
ncbi:hypothetical protein FZC84_16810 [Rossellomorea vietnamensis]|uniref:Uncharacterized protein n=1 Tax=Rossellomorea vietnamensis TaxID=218284 RepID=A0A5D4M9L1_9BACI|nr:hypothetical protein [Rossellomorea vietnamensis]TYR98043.1 hypothetical protein FZC84_16810 [Rossellomorea vietnamensis]